MAVLTRQHYKRLRFYWQGRGHGSAGNADSVDLDLAAAGLILRQERSFGGVYFAITSAGEVELAAEKAREIARRRPHHELAGRVAQWLRDQGRVTWENIELLVDCETGGRQAIRPDVFSMAATYDEKRINPCVHEVKVSRADFLADVARADKRAGYGKVAEVVYYAAPAGLVDVSEVPSGCGLLIEIEPGSFEVVKRPRKHRVALTTHHFMNLILKPGAFTSAW
ncbi:hypothetical protein E2P84_43035 [Burkholderia cepacia]|uniref:Uncharacterized protein n=1 Tax=Burkholderia cepacia TaxID=292 RepID=A0AAX2RRQ5_BURCE|nr:hypothetical protein [Burkholderia cepacia]TES61938.1 hypothetical protein E2P84_43035 [Burkholderia cepacia]TET01583.1 hypothetical protein E3D36_16220 [Burkholderia cepacia]TEU47595.1 hypothetical protein E3D37_16455 [Burkholderia cepacia]TEU53467.1 hypothetical protein E3D38_12040 [Burkholderia cepacia]TEV02073.1 hypothetical protein E3D40_12970 [Burkholderia cepacia]